MGNYSVYWPFVTWAAGSKDGVVFTIRGGVLQLCGNLHIKRCKRKTFIVLIRYYKKASFNCEEAIQQSTGVTFCQELYTVMNTDSTYYRGIKRLMSDWLEPELAS